MSNPPNPAKIVSFLRLNLLFIKEEKKYFNFQKGLNFDLNTHNNNNDYNALFTLYYPIFQDFTETCLSDIESFKDLVDRANDIYENRSARLLC